MSAAHQLIHGRVVEVKPGIDDRDPRDEALGELAAECVELGQGAQLAGQVDERIAHGVAAPEHQPLEAALELAQQRQRYREY